MRRLLIVGSGRSGTGWVAEVLRSAGLTCGHEAIFNEITADPAVPYDWPMTYQAEASWLAIPRLPVLSVGVVLVVRHPLAVVKSHLDLGFFQNDHVYTRAALRMTPELAHERTEADMALLHWLRLNERAAAYADLIYRLDVFDSYALDQILQLGGHQVAHDEIVRALDAPVANQKNESKFGNFEVDWTMFRPQLAKAAQSAAERWGY